MSWQPSLVDRGPTRRLPGSKGETWWGVDPSTKRIAVACAYPAGRPWPQTNASVFTESLPDVDGPARLDAAYREARDLADTLLGVCGPPGLVVVEQPSGTHQNLELVYVVGAIMAGLWAGLEAVRPHFETVTSGTWKKELLGYGAIKKPKPAEVRAGATYAVLDWAREVCGYAGSVWDEADALAIACWARQDVRLEP